MMDAQTNPLVLPEAYNTFVLSGDPFDSNGEAAPGKTTIISGGEREAKIEGMQSPGESGATTTDRGDELGKVAYQIEAWTPEQLAAISEYRRKLRTAQKRRGGRRKVLELIDMRLEDQDYDRVVVQRVSPIKTLKPTLWAFEVAFSEYKPRVARGGPVKPKNAELDAAARADKAATEEINKAFKELEESLKKASQGGG